MKMRTFEETANTWTEELLLESFATVNKFWFCSINAPMCPHCSYNVRDREWDSLAMRLLASCHKEVEEGSLWPKFKSFFKALDGGKQMIQDSKKDSALLLRHCFENFILCCVPGEARIYLALNEMKFMSDMKLILANRKGSYFTIEG